MISGKPIGRLSLYRRLLNGLMHEGVQSVYSHDLAARAGVTAAQVRRDIMNIGYSGNPNRGYDVRMLVESISNFLDDPDGQNVALVGVGNLGRAILAFFSGRRPKLSIVAAFDSDPEKFGRVIRGCRCYSIDQAPEVIRELNIKIATLCVPANVAQEIADLCIRAGVKGILNFAPVPLHVSGSVYVEDIDMTMSIEKVAYFARTN
ncbi:MAG: redox-sensing transcriptional repressor Rex [Candidatus Latescibacteria bacterium]|nr:redox-sensing transcriptional repressor Rex [Candidatus Latescibacterota bacterium]